MIYCERQKKYIKKNECYKCIFYIREIGACNYRKWYPGLKKGREWNDK